MCLTPKTTEKGSMELERLPVTLFDLIQSPNFLGCILLSLILFPSLSVEFLSYKELCFKTMSYLSLHTSFQ